MNQDSYSDHSQEEVPDYEAGIRKFGATYNMITDEQKSYHERDDMILARDHMITDLVPETTLLPLSNNI